MPKQSLNSTPHRKKRLQTQIQDNRFTIYLTLRNF